VSGRVGEQRSFNRAEVASGQSPGKHKVKKRTRRGPMLLQGRPKGTSTLGGVKMRSGEPELYGSPGAPGMAH